MDPAAAKTKNQKKKEKKKAKKRALANPNGADAPTPGSFAESFAAAVAVNPDRSQKRSADKSRQPVPQGPAPVAEDGDGEDLEFEDPFGDDVDEEDAAFAAANPSGGMDVDGKEETKPARKGPKAKGSKALPAVPESGAADMDADEEDEEDDDDDEDGESKKKPRKPKKVWRPGVDPIEPDEQLEYESSAYNLFHRMRVTWPCLSFDIARDRLGDMRTRFPHTAYIVAGTQAESADKNKVMILKVSDLHRTKHDSDSDEDSDDDTLDDDPVLEEKFFMHQGGVNRLRLMPQHPNICATQAETGKVHVFDIAPLLAGLDTPPMQRLPPTKPMFTFAGQQSEGFALDWSPHEGAVGRLACGDGKKNIFVWNPANSSWVVDKTPYTAHGSSVEDLQWSPTQPDVFASCSSDRTIRIWDTRVHDRSMLFVAAHHDDVNVISWNRKVANLLVSGSDDGTFKTWDLRNFKSNGFIAMMKWHRGPITSVEWNPHEDSVLSVASADNSVTIWDMSLEADPEAAPVGAELEEKSVPPQLLFVHMGQNNVKEVHWHPQIPHMTVSTAEDGFNFFQPADMMTPITGQSAPTDASMSATAAPM